VLVTGATSGIGQATANALAARGATIAITGRDPERTERTARDLRTLHMTARLTSPGTRRCRGTRSHATSSRKFRSHFAPVQRHYENSSQQ
jgi:NAD(P)-dependent dehydrogenase (short-subunit alcohol dehydrogenase family)